MHEIHTYLFRSRGIYQPQPTSGLPANQDICYYLLLPAHDPLPSPWPSALIAPYPPSTFRSVALIKAASRLARKVTAPATSAISPSLQLMWNLPQVGSQ